MPGAKFEIPMLSNISSASLMLKSKVKVTNDPAVVRNKVVVSLYLAIGTLSQANCKKLTLAHAPGPRLNSIELIAYITTV